MPDHIRRIVMVHGAWHHGALLEPVARELRNRGWEAYTPTIAGHTPGTPPPPDLTVAQMTDSLREYIEARDLTDFVLYGHSAGGVFITTLMPFIRDRVRRVVFHNGVVPGDGRCVFDEMPPAVQLVIERMKDPGSGTLPPPPFPMWRDAFIQDGDYDLALSTYRSLVPEPFATYDTAIDQKPFFGMVMNPDPGRVLPVSYLYATADAVMPTGFFPGHPGTQPENGWGYLRFIRSLGAPRMIEISGGSHEIGFTNPGLLATKVIEAARD